MNLTDKVRQNIVENLFKIESLELDNVVLDEETLVPYQKVNVSIRMNSEDRLDFVKLGTKELENKFRLGLSIGGEKTPTFVESLGRYSDPNLFRVVG